MKVHLIIIITNFINFDNNNLNFLISSKYLQPFQRLSLKKIIKCCIDNKNFEILSYYYFNYDLKIVESFNYLKSSLNSIKLRIFYKQNKYLLVLMTDSEWIIKCICLSNNIKLINKIYKEINSKYVYDKIFYYTPDKIIIYILKHNHTIYQDEYILYLLLKYNRIELFKYFIKYICHQIRIGFFDYAIRYNNKKAIKILIDNLNTKSTKKGLYTEDLLDTLMYTLKKGYYKIMKNLIDNLPIHF